MSHGSETQDQTRNDRTTPVARRAIGLFVTVLAVLAMVVLAVKVLGGGIAHAAVAELSITETGFGPTTIEVLPGTDVIWTNDGTNSHDIVSDDGGFAASGPLAPGDSYTVTFDALGTYEYHSSVDAGFTGQIIVTNDASASIDGAPSARPSDQATTPAVPTTPDSPTSIPTEMAFTGAAETIGLTVAGALVLFMGWALATGAGPGLGRVEPWRILAFADSRRFGFTDERLPHGRWRRTPRSTTQANLLPGAARTWSRTTRRALSVRR